jgi:hypothetical protein
MNADPAPYNALIMADRTAESMNGGTKNIVYGLQYDWMKIIEDA